MPASLAPLSYAGPPFEPPPRTGSRIALVISWMVIWGTVAIIAGLPFVMKSERVVEPPSVQLKFAARYAVGLKSISSQVLSAGNSKRQFEDMVRQAAVTDTDQLRSIPVLVELNGPESAGKLLDEFEKTNPPPQLLADAKLLRTIYEKGPDALDPGQKKGLVERQDWFGQLALSFGKPADSPERKAVIAPAQRVIFAAVALFAVGGISFLVGLALLIWFAVRLLGGTRAPVQPQWGQQMPYGYVDPRPEPMRTAYVPDPAAPTVFLEAFAIYLGGFLAMSILVRAFFPKVGLGQMILALAVPVAAAIVWPRLRGLSWDQVVRGFGLYRGRGIFREIGSGLAGYIVGVPILALAMLLTLLLTRFGGKQPTHPIINEVSTDFWNIVKLYLLASVWAPITEEMLFRGAFFHHLRRRHGWIVSAAIISFIFAAIHPQGILGIPMLMTIAFILAGLREWRGSIIASMVGHAINNAMAVTLLILLMG